MADEAIGTARIDVIANTATAEAQIKALERGVSQFGQGAADQYNKASTSAKRYADSLTRQVDMLGKTRAEQIAFNAQARIGGELGDAIAKKALARNAELAASTVNVGKTARELNFAMRGMPAQITDIVTSLASGQRPMMVLLQQGGQVKDMFGGIVPAAKAVGTSLLGLINPITVTAGVVAALGAAWVSAENDLSAFNKALVTTGNFAGKTSSQLQAMVGSIASAANTTQGNAREALQKVAETGRFAGAQFDLVAAAAAKMDSATGQSIDDTIKKFEELAKAPVDGLLKLNETEHFLTQAQLDRVRALQAEGKEQEAAAEAARIYATRLDDVATAAEAARPHLASLWKEAKEEGSAAITQVKDFAEFLAAAGEQYKNMPWYARLLPSSAPGAITAALRNAQPVAPVNVKPVAGAIDSTQAKAAAKLQEEAAKLKDRYLTREEEKTRALAELDKLRAQYSDQEYQNLKKQIELRFADKDAARRAQQLSDFRAEDLRQMRKEIDAEGKVRDERDRSAAATKAYAAGLQDMLDTRQRAIDLQVQSIGMGQREVEQRAALLSIDREYNRQKASLEKQQRDTSSAIAKADFQDQLDRLAKFHDDSIRETIEGFRNQEEARKNAALGAHKAIADFIDDAGNAAAQTRDLFTNAFDGMTDAVGRFVATGKLDFSDMVESIIADMARLETRVLASQVLDSILGRMTPGQQSQLNAGAGSFVDSIYGSANGNVFSTPSLSAYSNTIVDKPTFFANGGNVMGESGPEAIMPLTRGPNGKLGVQASGGEAPQVEINISNNGQPVQARQTGQRMDGKKMIVDLVLEAVANDVASGGKVAKAGQQRFGWQRRGVPVGGA